MVKLWSRKLLYKSAQRYKLDIHFIGQRPSNKLDHRLKQSHTRVIPGVCRRGNSESSST